MCLSVNKNKKIPYMKSLPKVCARDQKNNRKVHLSALKLPGSYTLEAVVVLPFTAAFWVFILFFFRVMQIETEVQESLYYAGRMTAVEASATDNEVLLLASAEGFFLAEMSNYDTPADYISGGKYGISLLKSDVSGDTVHLIAEYRIKLPLKFFMVRGIRIRQNSCNYKWTGKNTGGDGEEDPFVYYTDYGSVYHTSTDCSYLKLSIHSCSQTAISQLRSRDGSIYYPCTECGADKISGGTVYYTNYGTNYHSSTTCSGLKRSIHMTRKSQISGLKACSKCGGG